MCGSRRNCCEGLHLRVLGAEEIQKIADGAVVETKGVLVEGSGERLGGTLKQGSQRMLEGRKPVHRGMGKGRPDLLCHRAGVLFKDIAGRDLHVDHGGGDVRVAHQLHECRQADAGANHIRGKRMPEAVGMGEGSLADAAVIAEQRTHSGGCHTHAAGLSLQRDEQRRAALLGPFQPQIVVQ